LTRRRPVSRGWDLNLTPDPVQEDDAHPPKPGVTTETRPFDTQIPTSAAEGPVPFRFGLQKRSGKLQYVFVKPVTVAGYSFYDEDVWLVIEHCVGEIDAMLGMSIDGKPPDLGSVEVWHHLGTTTQGVDPNLAAVDPSWNEDFVIREDDVYHNGSSTPVRGVAYSVVVFRKIGARFPNGMPAIEFEYRAMKPLDPRTGTRPWSTNPWVQWYEWTTHPLGRARATAEINTAKLITACNVADEVMADGSPRYESHLSIENEATPDDWDRVFQLLTDGYMPRSGGQIQPYSDRPAAVVASYSDADLLLADPPAGRSDEERPNHVVIRFTEVHLETIWPNPAAVYVWDAQAKEEAMTVEALDPAHRRTATYDLPWIHNRGRAKRLAVYLANNGFFDFTASPHFKPLFGERVIGDVIDLSIGAFGLGPQPFRVRDIERLPDGSCRPLLVEYSDARFSEEVLAEASPIASVVPSPGGALPPPANAQAVVEGYDDDTGHHVRARVTWDPITALYFDAVEIRYSIDGGTEREAPDSRTGPVLLPATEGAAVQITLRSRSAAGILSDPVILNANAAIPAPPEVLNLRFIGDMLAWDWPEAGGVPYPHVREFRVYDANREAARKGTPEAHRVRLNLEDEVGPDRGIGQDGNDRWIHQKFPSIDRRFLRIVWIASFAAAARSARPTPSMKSFTSPVTSITGF